ncbi:hypothetical protein GHT06_006735 [Daphnia sinensis]|nr:hypothetical protein GHT06_006735 [Daphnia sinensis]
MLWKTEHCPPIESPSDFENRFRKSIATQTEDFSEHDIVMEAQEEEMENYNFNNDSEQINDCLAEENLSQQEGGVVVSP